ncbi:MAG: phosphodiester glycosidase family protein [Clostridia bacterium]|nr:phosphodiester glycosidase family protein [Clostridia bacterium]
MSENRVQNQILNDNVQHKGREKGKEKGRAKKKRGFFSKFFSVISSLIIVGSTVGLFLMYGPYSGFREWYITTAMTTMHHQYLATYLFSQETINDVLDRNKMVEIDAITDPSLLTTTSAGASYVELNEYEEELLKVNPDHPEYNIIKIEGKGYTGYATAIFDVSKFHVLATKKLKKSGQYVTTMANDNNAVLAFNGGFFVDLKEDRTGGTPLGLTIVNGQKITDSAYDGEGGVIGFDKNNNLILGKMTSKEAEEREIRDCVTSGPFLIINGQASRIEGNGGWGTAPRTAIGQRRDGVVVMLVIDGRRVGKPGASMETLIELMQRYGAYNAAALDGGTSSVIVENGKLLNDPIDCDGKHKTRPVATGFGLIMDDSNYTYSTK